MSKKLGNDPVGRKLIGQTDDFVHVPYVPGDLTNTVLAHLNTAYYHAHGEPFTYPKYANAVTLTSAAGAWNTTGAIIEVIPANALSVSNFDLHWISVSGISANCEGIIDFYKGLAGSEVWIGDIDIYRNAVQSQEGAKRIMIKQQEVNERISCKFSTDVAGAVTCGVKFNGHYYA